MYYSSATRSYSTRPGSGTVVLLWLCTAVQLLAYELTVRFYCTLTSSQYSSSSISSILFFSTVLYTTVVLGGNSGLLSADAGLLAPRREPRAESESECVSCVVLHVLDYCTVYDKRLPGPGTATGATVQWQCISNTTTTPTLLRYACAYGSASAVLL